MVEQKPARYTVAVDFDGTLCRRAWPGIGDAMPGMDWFLGFLDREDFDRVLYTLREGERLDEALSWLAGHGFPRKWWTAVNANTPAQRERWGNDPRKIAAHRYVDDLGAGFPWTGPEERRQPDWSAIAQDILDERKRWEEYRA